MPIITMHRDAQLRYIELHLAAKKPEAELYDLGMRDGFNEALRLIFPEAIEFYVTDAVMAEDQKPGAPPYSDGWAVQITKP